MVRYMVVMQYIEILCQMFLTAVDHGIMHEIYHAGVAQKYHVILEIGLKCLL